MLSQLAVVLGINPVVLVVVLAVALVMLVCIGAAVQTRANQGKADVDYIRHRIR
jgi:hypothetical protein